MLILPVLCGAVANAASLTRVTAVDVPDVGQITGQTMSADRQIARIAANADKLIVAQVFKASMASDTDVTADIRQIAETLRTDLGNAVQWKPTRDQIEAISATKMDAEKLNDYVEALYGSIKPGQPAAKPGQTEIITIGPDLNDLPGGYIEQIFHFSPDISIYGFSYVEPGEDLGMRYDGLIRVGAEWIFIPKAWRAFDN